MSSSRGSFNFGYFWKRQNTTSFNLEEFVNRPIQDLGDFADPSIVRDGSDYYMTHSSYNYFASLRIWYSDNLKHWESIGFALHKMLDNVWAPDFIKYHGKFYIYFPANGTNWMITADNPHGPWSDPINLHIGGIDPGHIATPAGKRYLYFNGGNMVALSKDGLSVKGKTKHVYNGWKYPKNWSVQCFCLESPKLTYHNGYYYLTSAEGGTSGPATSHMVVSARSKSPTGPWKNSPCNPVIHTYSSAEEWWSKGHGSLIDDEDGNWYIVYHAYKKGNYPMGRYTLIQPVKCTEGGWSKTTTRNAKKYLPRMSLIIEYVLMIFLKVRWTCNGSFPALNLVKIIN